MRPNARGPIEGARPRPPEEIPDEDGAELDEDGPPKRGVGRRMMDEAGDAVGRGTEQVVDRAASGCLDKILEGCGCALALFVLVSAAATALALSR